jgi:hypothetical protein
VLGHAGGHQRVGELEEDGAASTKEWERFPANPADHAPVREETRLAGERSAIRVFAPNGGVSAAHRCAYARGRQLNLDGTGF